MITSFSDAGYVCINEYTSDREFYIVTTNAVDSNYWETCVFSNNPATDQREFESLIEMVYSKSEEDARATHKVIFNKWNTIEVSHNTPVWLTPTNPEDHYGIGEERL